MTPPSIPTVAAITSLAVATMVPWWATFALQLGALLITYLQGKKVGKKQATPPPVPKALEPPPAPMNASDGILPRDPGSAGGLYPALHLDEDDQT